MHEVQHPTKDLTEIKRIIKEYYEQQCANQLDNLGETEKNPTKTETTKSDSKRNK